MDGGPWRTDPRAFSVYFCILRDKDQLGPGDTAAARKTSPPASQLAACRIVATSPRKPYNKRTPCLHIQTT
jgi:hypothetical protein